MPGIARVIPSILTDDKVALEKMIRQAEQFTDFVQIDIMDGTFVPSKSINSSELKKLGTKLEWEVHLMVEDPLNHLRDFQQAGAKKVIFHVEAAPSTGQMITKAKRLGLMVGLASNPDTSITTILPHINHVDSILFLTVDPGYYGSPFRAEVMDKVAELRKIEADIEIGVDGGIKENNIAEVAIAGVDTINVGSAIFLQPDPGESYRRLVALAEEGSRQRNPGK
jgi:ribulose-phosphate 3-epimerase